jgi:hypothetical protein
MAIRPALISIIVATLGLTNVVTAAGADPYAAALAAVEQAAVEVNTDPTRGIASLRSALVALHEFAPELAADAGALELRTMAELALARAQLAAGEREAAIVTIDAALVSLGATTLPIERLGPSLGALVEQRRDALAARGEGRLQVRCAVPCRVYVDERGSTAAAGEGLTLPLGEHRLWVAAADDTSPPLRRVLQLTDPGATLSASYPVGPQGVESVEPPAPTLLDAPGPGVVLDRPRKRVAPRWVELAALATGGAAVIAGAVLWALDSRCPRGVDPTHIAACPELYDTRNAGIALVSAGAATALTGGVMLIVDETRVGDRRGRELGLVWTTRF